jgi:IS30 family transposase
VDITRSGLRSKRRIRRSRHARIFKDSHGEIADAISIRERPAEIEDRAIPGHWEGDLIGGTKNSHIATLVERHSRFTFGTNSQNLLLGSAEKGCDGFTESISDDERDFFQYWLMHPNPRKIRRDKQVAD